MKRSIVLLAAILAAVVTAPAASTSAPVTLAFDKRFDPARTAANGAPTWTGTIAGDGWSGSLEAVLTDYRASGVVEHVCVTHAVDAGTRSFTWEGCGTFNNVTNRIVLNGEVVSGWMAGARVHDDATRFDPSISRFVGEYRLAG